VREIARKKPQRQPSKKTYLKPRLLSPEQAEALRRMPAARRSRAIEKLPAGTLIPPRRAVVVSPERHRIEIFPDGSIRKTYLRMTEPGKFRAARSEKFPDANKAMRKATHTIESLGSEIEREEAAQAAIDAIHKAVYENWQGWNQAQRQAAKALILGVIDGLYKRTEKSKPLSVRDFDKIKRYGTSSKKVRGREKKRLAVERLNGAIKLLNENNKGAACARLVGASNALIRQISIIRDQRVSTTVDREVYKKHRVTRDAAIVKAVNRIEGIAKGLERKRARSTTLTQLKRAVNAITELQVTHPAFVNARKELVRAIRMMGEGKSSQEVRKQVRRAIREVLLTGSENARYSRQTLQRINTEYGEKMFVSVTARQLRLFGQNAEFWYRKASASQRKNMVEWLRQVRSLITGTRAQPLQLEIRWAESELAENPAKCKEILLKVAGIMEKIYKK